MKLKYQKSTTLHLQANNVHFLIQFFCSNFTPKNLFRRRYTARTQHVVGFTGYDKMNYSIHYILMILYLLHTRKHACFCPSLSVTNLSFIIIKRNKTLYNFIQRLFVRRLVWGNVYVKYFCPKTTTKKKLKWRSIIIHHHHYITLHQLTLFIILLVVNPASVDTASLSHYCN